MRRARAGDTALFGDMKLIAERNDAKSDKALVDKAIAGL